MAVVRYTAAYTQFLFTCLSSYIAEGDIATYKFIMLLSALAFVFVLQSTNSFDLVVLHTNDVHGRVDETNTYSGICSEASARAGACYGGVARRATLVREIRGNYSNVLLLDAGDEFQGTLWFTYYNGSEASHFMNRIGYDAMVRTNDGMV